MSDINIVAQMVKDFVTNQAIYNPLRVYQGYQNNANYGKDNNFIVVSRGNVRSEYLSTRYVVEDVQTTGNTVIIDYQVDFYGVNSDVASDLFNTYLSSYVANDYLLQFKSGIKQVIAVQNLTSEFDRGNYIKRYVVKFEFSTVKQIITKQNMLDLPAVELTELTNGERYGN